MSRTKLILITALVLINVVCLAFLLIQGDRRVPDGVYVTPSVLDLGKVKDTKELTGVFRLHNASRQPVRILDSRVGGGALKLVLPKERLEPGESMKAMIRVNPRGFFGQRTFDAVVTTDHPLSSEIRFLMTCHVTATKPLESILTDIGEFLPSAPVDKTVGIPLPAEKITLKRNDDDAGEQDDLLVTLEERQERSGEDEQEDPAGGGKYMLHLVGKAPARTGSFRKTVTLRAKGADWKEAKVIITGQVASAFRPIETVAFGFLDPGEEKTEEVILQGRFSPVIQSAHAAARHDSLKAEISVEGNRPVLKLTIRNDGPPGAFEDTVRVTMEDTDRNTYQVDVRVQAYFY